MISTKTKLVSAIAMLLVATIMMTSASFAWFTISSTAEISNLNVQMSATKNLEIAKIDGETPPEEPNVGDYESETNWGASVTYTDDDIIKMNFPATLTDDAIKSVTYDKTGRIVDLAECTAPELADISGGVGYYTLDINDPTEGTAGASVIMTCAAVCAVWLRTNIAGTITAELASDAQIKLLDVEGTAADGIEFSMALSYAAEDSDDFTAVDAATGFSAAANTTYKVFVTFFFDGETVHAADIAAGLQVKDLDISFSNAGISDYTDYSTPITGFGA